MYVIRYGRLCSQLKLQEEIIMGYILNDEQKDVVALAKEFADKEVAPLVKEYDISG